MLWAAEQIKLGATLRLQSQRESGVRRMQTYRHVIEAFESALFIYCRCTRAPEQHSALRATPVIGASELSTPADAIERVMEVSGRLVLSGTEDLEEAISVLDQNTSGTVRKEDYVAWVMNKINLGCTLTLAGKCDSASGDITRLEEAIDTFHSLLSDAKIHALPFEQALAYINLAEAFSSVGAVSSHEVHAAYLESAVQALASALTLVAPEEVQRLAQADPRSIA